MIAQGKVRVRGMPTPKSASLVDRGTPIEVESDEKRWVSRGAYKLLHALEVFPIVVAGKEAIDIGASTGGFTEVLLEAGARSVLALDVGRAQLHERLKADPRVTSKERTNVRNVGAAEVGGPFSLVVVDLSFISLCTVAGQIAALTKQAGDVIALIKPQFEVGKADVGKGGIVRSEKARQAAKKHVTDCLSGAGLDPLEVVPSPIKGSGGNVEYLLWLRKGRSDPGLEVKT